MSILKGSLFRGQTHKHGTGMNPSVKRGRDSRRLMSAYIFGTQGHAQRGPASQRPLVKAGSPESPPFV